MRSDPFPALEEEGIDVTGDEQIGKRKVPRAKVGIEGRYRSGTGRARSVWVTDLSVNGCRFFDRFGSMQAGKKITLRLGTVGPIPASVRWWQNHVNGIQFDEPLHDSVYKHICAHLSGTVPAGLDAGDEEDAGDVIYTGEDPGAED